MRREFPLTRLSSNLSRAGGKGQSAFAPPPGHFTAAVSTTRSVTGPSRPDSWSGSPCFHSRQLVKVKRPVGLGWPALSGEVKKVRGSRNEYRLRVADNAGFSAGC